MRDIAPGLLPRQKLIRTSELDQGDWSYRRGPLGMISRVRFSLVLDQLDRRLQRPVGQLLEVGYGSGLFLPWLSRYTGRLVGVDIHEHAAEVRTALAGHGVDATLLQGQMEALPLADASTDVVVAISCLEFVDDIDQAAAEIARVLTPGGLCVTVTPGHSWLLDQGLRLLTSERGEDTFQGRRGTAVPALAAHLRLASSTHFPPLIPERIARMYTCSVFEKPGAPSGPGDAGDAD